MEGIQVREDVLVVVDDVVVITCADDKNRNLLVEQGCSLGVIDLDTKQLIEDFPMESQGYQIDKPVVTDDKIYVRVKDLNELRIYENSYK